MADQPPLPACRITVDLTRDQAYALAELCKRIGFSDARTLSVDEAETRAMLAACDTVRAALAHGGIVVR